MALLALLPLAATAVWAALLLRSEARAQTEDRLRAEAIAAREAARPLLEAGDGAGLDALAKRIAAATGTRVTFVASEGRVVGDSDHDPATMEDHSGRPEVRAAVERGEGTALRWSGTVRQELVYVAVPADPARAGLGVIRVAVPAAALERRLAGVYLRIAAIVAPVALLALFSALFGLSVFTRAVDELTRAAAGVASGGPPVRTEAARRDDEVGALARAVHDMAQELERRITTIARERNEMKAIVEGIGEGLVAVDARGRILLCNKAAERLLGMGAPPVPGSLLAGATRNGDVAALARETIASAVPGARRIEVRVSPAVEARAVEARATPFGERPGQASGAVVLLHDVTESERYDRMRRDFVANVSHELRTPLALVKGFLETLEDGAIRDPEHGPRFLGILKRHVDGLERLVADLLELSALESGAESRPVEAVSIAAALDAVLGPFADVFARRRLALERDVPDDLPAASGLPDRVERALRNLVDNAVKFAPEGGRVSVRARLSEGGDRVEVEVADDGPGIPPEDQARVFERFYRVEKSRNRDAGGTGLGLAIVKHVMQQAGGSVSLRSEAGKGSAFTLSFLRWGAEERAEPPAPATAAANAR
jgi:two-component system phosphate regulon sensor histidine kinase PhoR